MMNLSFDFNLQVKSETFKQKPFKCNRRYAFIT